MPMPAGMGSHGLLSPTMWSLSFLRLQMCCKQVRTRTSSKRNQSFRSWRGWSRGSGRRPRSHGMKWRSRFWRQNRTAVTHALTCSSFWPSSWTGTTWTKPTRGSWRHSQLPRLLELTSGSQCLRTERRLVKCCLYFVIVPSAQHTAVARLWHVPMSGKCWETPQSPARARNSLKSYALSWTSNSTMSRSWIPEKFSINLKTE